jgi:hypothetical protein
MARAHSHGPRDRGAVALKWIVGQGIESALIDPGKPWQNSRAKAKVVIETSRRPAT